MHSESTQTQFDGQVKEDWVKIQALLAAPFPADDIEWRIGRCGENSRGVWATALAYVTNRGIMNRLDEVVGSGDWRNEYMPIYDGNKLIGYQCGISVYRPGCGYRQGEWIAKWDAAPLTGFEAIKGGHSDSMKRAAVQWGIGRYLYGLDEAWCDTSTEKVNGWKYVPAKPEKDGKKGHRAFYWTPPSLPKWALPAAEQGAPAPADQKYKPEEGTLVDDLIAEMRNQTDLDSLGKYMKKIKPTVQGLPDFAQKKISAEYMVHRGEVEAREGRQS